MEMLTGPPDFHVRECLFRTICKCRQNGEITCKISGTNISSQMRDIEPAQGGWALDGPEGSPRSGPSPGDGHSRGASQDDTLERTQHLGYKTDRRHGLQRNAMAMGSSHFGKHDDMYIPGKESLHQRGFPLEAVGNRVDHAGAL